MEEPNYDHCFKLTFAFAASMYIPLKYAFFIEYTPTPMATACFTFLQAVVAGAIAASIVCVTLRVIYEIRKD